MGDEPIIDKLGPLALPVGLILSILTLILAVTKIIPEVGLKVAAVISFLVLLGCQSGSCQKDRKGGR
jgi:hypothetical protein